MKTFNELTLETKQPIVISDDQGFVVYINQCFTDVYLWDSELIGQTLADIIPSNFHDSHNLGFSRFTMTEISHVANHPINAMVITKDGRAVLSEHYITAQNIEGKWFFTAQLRPLSGENK
ncbi:PAS domain S-box protein [Crocosphaera sp. XPORK-15E]|uniref:PAS domain S-box protein n=1 Tax=Crocosphaera sp. XPORK-15E TaxID=3110247 RepID=UPI002B1EE78C|nr:PAS domain S-box protein [Crocosphaera sp. XPORK-15E]MEA5532947.1 PAS domain S-box protein [Crocosphaera sp. XPORK-15E]